MHFMPAYQSESSVAPTPPNALLPQHASQKDTQTEVRCLLIASIFPPIHGGSAVVYDNLCRFMPEGSMRVLTAKKNYIDNATLAGWEMHDAALPYSVDRVAFLRPRILPAPANKLVSVWRLLFQDVPVYARALLSAARIVKTHGINVVCVGEVGTGSWLAIALRKLYGVKVIIYVHGEEITTHSSGRLSGNKRQGYLQSADKVIAVSRFTVGALMRLMNVAPQSIALIENGVDTRRFTPGPHKQELVAQHRLAGKKVVVTVGRLVARKGIDKSVLAMQKILQRRQDVHYLIIGDGEMRREIEQMITSGGMHENVTLVGTISDTGLVDYLRLCDVFLMPNRTLENGDTEGYGLVFREANACGKPVIGGRAGGVVEAVRENESGLLVDGNNVDDIAAAVERLLDDPAFAARLGTGGLQLARDNSTESVAQRFLAECELLLTNGFSDGAVKQGVTRPRQK